MAGAKHDIVGARKGSAHGQGAVIGSIKFTEAAHGAGAAHPMAAASGAIASVGWAEGSPACPARNDWNVLTDMV